jgi:hypothetical protein
MAFFTRVLYKLSLFDSTVAFLAPRASAVGYLCGRFPRLPLLGRCRRRACRPRASVARYLCARSPRLPSVGRRRRRACRPRALVSVTCAPPPLACHLLVAAAVALVAIAPQLAVTF